MRSPWPLKRSCICKNLRYFSVARVTMSRSYTVCARFFVPPPDADHQQDAVAALNTLQSNFTVVDAIRKSGRSMNRQAIPEMISWCKRIGYQVCASPAPNWRNLADTMLAARGRQPPQPHPYRWYQRQRLDIGFCFLYPIRIPSPRSSLSHGASIKKNRPLHLPSSAFCTRTHSNQQQSSQ